MDMCTSLATVKSLLEVLLCKAGCCHGIPFSVIFVVSYSLRLRRVHIIGASDERHETGELTAARAV